MNDITFFNYHGSDIRTVEVNNEFWWVLADICKALELSNASIVANRLDEDEVTKLDLGGQTGITNLINESGLYSVILRSDKPQAKPFRRWITHEVLPSIRKFGGYRLSHVPLPSAKSWYGENVMTVSDIAEYLGISNEGARSYIKYHLRDGLDYFVLKGNSLKLFKFENPMLKSSSSSTALLVKSSAFYELVK